jgi:hypothetical protein
MIIIQILFLAQEIVYEDIPAKTEKVEKCGFSLTVIPVMNQGSASLWSQCKSLKDTAAVKCRLEHDEYGTFRVFVDVTMRRGIMCPAPFDHAQTMYL